MENKNTNILQPILNLIELLAGNFGTLLVKTFHYLALFLIGAAIVWSASVEFLSMMDKPDVDTIEGLSPAISIEQKSSSHNPRSTVGTVTEIYDYLRLLYARVGTPRCP